MNNGIIDVCEIRTGYIDLDTASEIIAIPTSDVRQGQAMIEWMKRAIDNLDYMFEISIRSGANLDEIIDRRNAIAKQLDLVNESKKRV